MSPTPTLEATKRVLASTDHHRARRWARICGELAEERVFSAQTKAIFIADAKLAREHSDARRAANAKAER
jgi:hypothetical protein